MALNFDDVLADLARVFQLPAPPPAPGDRLVLNIEGLGALRVSGVGDRVVISLERPRLHQNMPSRNHLLHATHFFNNRPVMMSPLELKDGAAVGLCVSMDQREITVSALQEVVDSLADTLDEIFASP
jgi:hypothetical protein